MAWSNECSDAESCEHYSALVREHRAKERQLFFRQHRIGTWNEPEACPPRVQPEYGERSSGAGALPLPMSNKPVSHLNGQCQPAIGLSLTKGGALDRSKSAHCYGAPVDAPRNGLRSYGTSWGGLNRPSVQQIACLIRKHTLPILDYYSTLQVCAGANQMFSGEHNRLC